MAGGLVGAVEVEELVGREAEQEELRGVLQAAADGRGGLLLVAGEAGVGKTRLVNHVFRRGDLSFLSAAATQEGTPPYGQIVSVFRSYLRLVPDGLADCGPLGTYLALLLPELDVVAETTDRASLFEAIHCAFATIGRRATTCVFLDDLNWTDDATLELLPALAASLEAEPVLVVAAYRSDEIPRGHPLRRLRAELRRGGRLHELALEPLDAEETAALAARVVGGTLGAGLTTAIYARTHGVPFFVEELSGALADGGHLVEGTRGIELIDRHDLPLPESVRDAVLLRTMTMSESARAALETAAVAGLQFGLELVTSIEGDEGVEEVLDSGFANEVEPGLGAFRHALTREALYQGVPRVRRRSLHRAVAESLEATGAPPARVAEHWLLGHAPEQARRALLAAAEASYEVYAYRDTANAARRALELWPEGEDESGRVTVLEKLAESEALSGNVADAVLAWREAAEGLASGDDPRRFAELQRRLAGLYEIQGAWDAALAARSAAAQSFLDTDLPGEAAAERLAAAASLQSTGSMNAALELIAQARIEAERAQRVDLQARLLGLEGLARARLGDVESGLELAREGFTLALAENLVGPVAEVHDRLGLILENSSDYSGALEAWRDAYAFCELHGISDRAYVCLSCVGYVMRKTGDWKKAAEVFRGLISSHDAPRSARCAGLCELGLLYAVQGQGNRARPLLTEGLPLASRIGFLIVEIDGAWGLARVEELAEDYDAAADRCRLLLERARACEDCHCPVPALRWATTFFAQHRHGADAGACVDVLAQIASQSGSTEARSALAHGLGEVALLNGDPEQAAVEFARALELLRELDLPLDRAETQVRAAAALVAADERETAVERLVEGYRAARKLRARPLAAVAAAELTALGERVDRRLGRRAAADLDNGGLSRRELEVVRLVAGGSTNKEIARDLFISPRTVDMHVRNILVKLGCRSRTEATRRAAELKLLR
jgi:DNA-binding NarL/FixJ family response regulator